MSTTTSQNEAAEGQDLGGVTTEVRDRVLLIGLDRASKRNALTPKMFDDLSAAYARYESDDALRCAVLFGHGASYCAGADLVHLKGIVEQTNLLYREDEIDPFGMTGRRLSKPVVAAVHGLCFAGGMELALNADIIVAAERTLLGQLEVKRGLFAFGGGAVRWAERVGWGNAQRYLLTGETLEAAEAHRIGLVQEVVPDEQAFDRALAIAGQIAAAAPIGVRDSLAVARLALHQGPDAGFTELARRRAAIVQTEDAAEGVVSFLEKRDGDYAGR